MAAAGGRVWWYEAGAPPTIRQGLEVRPLYRERTPFQTIQVFEHDELGRVLVLDDIVQTTQGDEFHYHEMLAHVPLLGAPAAHDVEVLIVGGGDGGILREVLVHDFVTRVDMVEIDERVIEVSREWIGIHGDYDDPRVRLVVGDAAAFAGSPGARARPYDVVIVDAPDPVGPGKVLYSETFLDGVRATLKPRGVVARHAGVPAYQPALLENGAARTRRVLGSCEVYRASVPTYIGGDMAFVVGAKDGSSVARPRVEHAGRCYDAGVHRAAFVLPPWWRDLIGRP